jgi:nitrite reductase/ring-hydroxylating ferredoxin subunit
MTQITIVEEAVFAMAERDGGDWVTVASRAALAEGDVLGVEVRGQAIALYNVEGEIYATDNVCSHAFAFLSDGWLDGDVIECPLHAGRFEVKSGKGLGPPIPCDIRTFPVRVVGDEVQVRV